MFIFSNNHSLIILVLNLNFAAIYEYIEEE